MCLSEILITIPSHSVIHFFTAAVARISINQLQKTGCGDGYRTLPEECDDGNTRDGDGCDHNCKIEPGYYCKRGSYNNIYLTDYPCCHISCDDCTIPGPNTCQNCREGFVAQGITCVGNVWFW